MKQSRRASAIESLSNTAIGFGVAVLANYYVLPLFGFNVTWSDSFGLGIIFTLISIARGYLLRRAFEILRVRNYLP